MSRPENQFDTIRIIAAASVLVSHSVPLTYGSDTTEMFVQLSHGQTTGGTIAVKVFFIMSGYLVTGSYTQNSRAAVFITKRALRIVPALWVVLLLLAFVAGPLLTTLSVHNYFASRSVYLFLLRNMVFRYTDNLPGILTGNPFPASIDGPLWTLRYEVACYCCVLLLGLAGLLQRVYLMALYSTALLALATWPNDVRLPLACAFLAGSLFRVMALPRSKRLSLACLAGWALSLCTVHYTVLSSILAPYPVLMLATSRTARLPRLAKYGDVSYGLYIYAYPWQQLAAQLLDGRSAWYLNVIASAPPALLCAYLSWYYIESPALGLKDRIQRKAFLWGKSEIAATPLKIVEP